MQTNKSDCDSLKRQDQHQQQCRSENFNSVEYPDEKADDVVESFELLHQSIPWLQKSGVSSDDHKGQLRILQAAIDYIIDLEEQLTEHLSDDMYRVAIRESKAALERSLASRRPFADINVDVPPPRLNPEFLHPDALRDETGSHQRMS